MPNGDSLTIRHTPATVPGGARPGWGLPYQRLPQGRLTPESMLQQETQTGRQQIQNKYALQWKEVNRSRRFIGRVKADAMLRQIDTQAKQEMLQFNQQAQQQMTQLRNIDRLAGQRAIRNPEKLKARITFGSDIAESMYPTPEKEPSIPEQFGKLDVYSHRISQELERFQIVGGKAPSRLLKGFKSISPLATAISALRGPPKGRKGELQIWDPNVATKIKDPKTKKMVDAMGVWRKTEPEEIAEYKMWLTAEKDIAQRKTELAGRPDISRRRVQPGTKGGTFSDKIAESIRPRQTPTMAKPKVIRQRNTRTGKERISYDGGSTWQMIG